MRSRHAAKHDMSAGRVRECTAAVGANRAIPGNNASRASVARVPRRAPGARITGRAANTVVTAAAIPEALAAVRVAGADCTRVPAAAVAADHGASASGR